MARVQMLTTKDSFIDGRFVPSGFPVMVEEDDLSGKEKNLIPPGDLPPAGIVQQAAVGPTGPNPKEPQQIPPDAVQTVEGHVVPGAILRAETTSTAAQAEAEQLLDDSADAQTAIHERLAEHAAESTERKVSTDEDDLSGNKASLLAIAEAEGVELETDDNKADIVAKIRAHREAAALTT